MIRKLFLLLLVLPSLLLSGCYRGHYTNVIPSTAVAAGAAQPNWPFVATALLLQLPLMLLLPIVAGWWIRRRYAVSWVIFGMGALTFIASQVVHLPVNWALGLLGGGRGVALWPLVWAALVAGLTAALSEEGARYLVLHFWLSGRAAGGMPCSSAPGMVASRPLSWVCWRPWGWAA
jgi:hypothetical protein